MRDNPISAWMSTTVSVQTCSHQRGRSPTSNGITAFYVFTVEAQRCGVVDPAHPKVNRLEENPQPRWQAAS